MARAVGFVLPEDEEPQPWRRIMLMNKSMAKARNSRVQRFLVFCMCGRFTPGLGLAKLSTISCGNTLPAVPGLKSGLLGRKFQRLGARKGRSLVTFNPLQSQLAKIQVTLRATRACGNKFLRGSRWRLPGKFAAPNVISFPASGQQPGQQPDHLPLVLEKSAWAARVLDAPG